jgi:DNA polymerase I-like protein with 3'-5' exonuclease and polymerase domains
MKSCVFDIETDGLIEEFTKVHCLVVYDIEEDRLFSFIGDEVEHGLFFIKNFNQIIGHNIISFDLPILKKFFKWEPDSNQEVVDTLVMSKLIYPDRAVRDAKKGSISKDMYGRHSLKSWGQRLGLEKGDFTDFEEFSDEMVMYCENDVELNHMLYRKLTEANFSKESIRLEHDIHKICLKQTENGFPFDTRKASRLYAILAEKRNILQKELKKAFGNWTETETFIPKVNNKSRGYVKGVPFKKEKVIEFNPNSRRHIAKRLHDIHGWEPEKFTPTEEPKIDETVLSELPYPEAQLMAEAFRVNKLIAQLSEGKHAWLYHEKDGKIHGSVNTMGSVSSRCSHSHPNIGQVPSVKGFYGKECRELFYAPKGFSLLGCDVSGLEIRVVSHYLATFDGGDYAKTVIEGDVHEANRVATNLPTRDQAKTFIYGLLYGAGDAKLGQIVGKNAREGKKLKDLFFKKVPAFKKLRQKVFSKAERGFLFGLDGRKVPVRSVHSSLNSLCQSAGAIICKKWVVEFHKCMEEEGFKEGQDYEQVAFVHDEIQVLVRKGIEDEVGKIAIDSITKAGKLLSLKVPLTGEYNFGSNWAETH